MRDIVHNIGVVQSIAPAVQAATIKGAGIDLLGFDSVAIIISTGAIAGAGSFTPTLQESDDDVDANYTDVDADHLQGALPATLEASSVTKVGYRGFKRFVRPVLTKVSGTSIAAGAIAIKGDAAERPVA